MAVLTKLREIPNAFACSRIPVPVVGVPGFFVSQGFPTCIGIILPATTVRPLTPVLCAPFRVAAAHLRCNGQRASGSSCCDATAALPSLPSQPASHRGSAGATRAWYQHAAAQPTVAKWTRHRRPFSSPRKLLLAPQKEGQKACRSKVAGSVLPVARDESPMRVRHRARGRGNASSAGAAGWWQC